MGQISEVLGPILMEKLGDAAKVNTILNSMRQSMMGMGR